MSAMEIQKFPALFQTATNPQVTTQRHLATKDVNEMLTTQTSQYENDVNKDFGAKKEPSPVTSEDYSYNHSDYYYFYEDEEEEIIAAVKTTTKRPPPTIWFPSEGTCPQDEMTEST